MKNDTWCKLADTCKACNAKQQADCRKDAELKEVRNEQNR